jgi:hypothetical protein
MLDPTEAQTLAEQFGASPGQIARDHLISPRRRAAPGCRPAASPTPRVPQPALEPSTHPSTRRRASRPALPRGTDRARATPQPHRLPALARAPRQPHPALHRRPPARLTVPTAPAFAASKTTAWFHRAAAQPPLQRSSGPAVWGNGGTGCHY